MTTKIVSVYSGHDTQKIEGTLNNPKIIELCHSEIHHQSIADHGELAIFTDSRAIHNGRRDYISIVLNEENPVLDLEEKGIYSELAKKFEFAKGGKERG